ncbi:EAL domain-containing protein [Butyrivibrio sp. MC2013]|uniref:EAL domain-containing protein n=1 Tax=Butyrivibrio sp. MC2013 TaxID=1280686 RepID=UPI00040CE9B1|nr:GGDEF domain-containing protein [Butyrivibrio sp. MC2013]
MSWNISYTIVTTFVLILLMYFYLSRPRLKLKSNYVFTILVISEMATLLTDIVSTIMDMEHERFSVLSLYLANMAFFILYMGRSYSLLVYTITILRRKTSYYNHVLRVFSVIHTIIELITLSSFFTGLVFSIDPERGYVSGPMYNLVYIALYLYLISGIFFIILARNRLALDDFMALMLAHIVLVFGGIVRYLFPGVLLMDAFFMISILAFFLSFVSSDLYMDRSTRLFNDQAFENVAKEKYEEGSQFWFAALIIQNYREIRDVFGGSTTDEVIAKVADYLKKTAGKKDIYYLGDGGFLFTASDDSQSQMICDDLRERFKDAWYTESASVVLDAEYAEKDEELKISSAEQLLECLRTMIETAGKEYTFAEERDSSSENAKTGPDYSLPKQGRLLMNIIDQPMLDQITRGFAVKKCLYDAIDNNRMLIFLQPIVKADSGEIAGAEALARLDDKELGMIPPGEFIPIAEQNGKIDKLGEQIFRKSCAFMQQYGSQLGLEFININLSPIQCMDRNLADKLTNITKEYGIATNKIHLEITEESLIDEAFLEWQMKVLIGKGFTFSLDDYGSGYSNQFKVKRYPFNGVKLDMGIVWAHFSEPDRLLPTTVRMFVDRGLSVTAEGVENKDMAEGLCDMGCTYLQGFYFSRPLSVERFVEFAKSQRNSE